MKQGVLFIVFTIYTIGIQAQSTSSISGNVTNSLNDYPIENAEIYLSEVEINCFTDANGYFKLSKLSDNNYTLMVKHIGYEDYSTLVNLNQV